MAYGLEIYNSSGNLIVNQDYLNYQVVSSGTIANGGTWPTISDFTQQIYVRASTAGAIITSQSTQGGFVGDTMTINTVVQVSTGTVEYVIVKRNPPASSSTYGLRVFNSDGTSIAFDSGRTPCKIVSSALRVATNYLLETWSITANQPFTVPTGRKRYISGQFLVFQAGYEYDPWSGNFLYYNNKLTWTSDMQQTFGTVASNLWGYNTVDLSGSLSILTVDI